jgi:hypothetical protein
MKTWSHCLRNKVINRTKYTGQFKKKVTLSHIYSEVTSEPTITRYTQIVTKKSQSLFVIDAGKCFGPPLPGETVLKNGDSTGKGFCILQFAKTNSVTTVQGLFRTRFGIDVGHVPPQPNDL